MGADKMDVADLLSDETFLNYCRQSSPADVAYWENYLINNPGKRFLVEHARDQYVALFNALAHNDRDQQLALLDSRLNVSNPESPVNPPLSKNRILRFSLPLLFRVSAAAAVLILIGFFAFRFLNGSGGKVKTFVAANGERKTIQLPDGTVVALNGGSTLEIRGAFGKAGRDVYLKGEAFFDVKHNKKLAFIVHTPAMDVKALGTAFNVKAYGDELITETSLIRGLVEVTLKENHNQLMLLHPNQKIKWQHGKGTLVNVDPAASSKGTESPAKAGVLSSIVMTDHGDIREIAWKENKLIFEDELFSEIALLLERWYGAKINFMDESLKNYRFTGTFEKEDLRTVLGLLKETSNFNFTITAGDTLIVDLTK